MGNTQDILDRIVDLDEAKFILESEIGDKVKLLTVVEDEIARLSKLLNKGKK